MRRILDTGEFDIPHHGVVVPSLITETERQVIDQRVSINPVPDNCNAPAPLALNAGAYVGCQLLNGHAGPHCLVVNWA